MDFPVLEQAKSDPYFKQMFQPVERLEHPLYGNNYLLKLKKLCDEGTAEELTNYVANSYQLFFERLVKTNEEATKLVQEILRNKNFVSALVTTFSKMKKVSPEDRRICNTLYYDYATQSMQTPDKNILGLYYSLAKVVNKRTAYSLMGIGLPEEIAVQISAAAFSSNYPELNIRRANWIVVQSGSALMTQYIICNIYEILFTKMSDLFIHTMSEVYAPPGIPANAEDFNQVNENINNALLYELNEMPIDMIKQVLYLYAQHATSCMKYGVQNLYRFSMRTIDTRTYGRIAYALNQIDTDLAINGLYIP